MYWSLVSVQRKELPSFRYIKHERWDDISGDTQSVGEGARRLLAGEPENATGDGFQIRPDLPLGSIVAATDGIDCTLVEGHNRVTALVMQPDACPDTVEAYLARSGNFRTWPWW